MKFILITPSILVICLLTFFRVVGQPLDTPFRSLSIENGLSQNMITAICQDYKGLMWFGTRDGLNRYDGYSFTIFKVDVQVPNSITDNHITALFEDASHNLWVGTMHEGVLLYQREKAQFLKINLTGLPASAQFVSAIAADQEGNLVLAYLSGHIVKVIKPVGSWQQGDSLTVQLITQLNKDELQIPIKIHVTTSNILWVSGAKGGKTFDLSTVATTRVHNQWPTFVLTYQGTDIVKSVRDDGLSPLLNDVQEIKEDQDGQIWLTSVNGLYHVDPFQKTFFLYQFASNTTSLLPVRTLSKEKQIWIGTLDKGLALFNPATKRVVFKPTESFSHEKLTDMLVRVMHQGREGTIWLGTNGRGLYSHATNLALFPKVTFPLGTTYSRSIYALRPSGNDQKGILYSTLNELVQVDNMNDIKVNNELPVRSMSSDKEGFVWLGNKTGLYRYNSDTKLASRVLEDQGMILSVYVAEDQKVWFTTYTSLCVYDPQTKEVKKILFFADLAHKLETHLYSTIQPDIDGTLWVGTTNGLFHFDPVEFIFKKIYLHDPLNPATLSSNEVKAILPDPLNPAKYLWIGTPVGLNRLNKATGHFTHFTIKEGLPNNTIYGILGDELGNLWLSTNQGISVMNLKGSTFMNFDVNHGLQSNEFNTGAYYKSPSGELFFGGINGYNRFYPNKVLLPQQDVPIVISEVQLIGGNQENGTYHFTESAINKLHHQQNNIGVTLAVLDYTASTKIQYAYRIVNQDTSWISIGTNRQVALTNLSPGTYTFQARGTDGFGRWGNQIVEMTFEIAPPWWNSAVARILYLLLIIGIVSMYWRNYKRNLEKKQRIAYEHQQALAILELDEVKSRFLANITHEFRTPLTLINGHLERLKEQDISQEMTKQLSEMERNSSHLLRLINQLMDLSRLESGKYPIRYEERNILADLRAGVFAFHSYAEQKQIQLKLIIDQEAEEYLTDHKLIYDENVLLTILNNLLSNACKFTPQHGTVTIGFALAEKDQQVSVTVTDTGKGIPVEELPKIFDRFYQANSEFARHFEGSGIGLSLVKELTQLHGGTIGVESQIGIGTTFKVLLQLGSRESSTEDSTLKVQSVVTPFKEEPALPMMDQDELPLLLLVDDHPALRDFIQETLGENYRFLSATNGKEAIELAKQFVPDLVISDVMMPEMDGYALCGQLKQHELTSHVPIILLTARVSQEEKLMGLRQGADDYLTKPFSTAELRLRVRNILTARKVWHKKSNSATESNIQPIEVLPGEDAFLERLLHIIKISIADTTFGVEQLANLMHLSVSQLQRKVKAISGQVPQAIIQQVRMQTALELLRQGDSNVGEVAFKVGFENQGYFSRIFKRHYGFLPSDKEKINAYQKL